MPRTLRALVAVAATASLAACGTGSIRPGGSDAARGRGDHGLNEALHTAAAEGRAEEVESLLAKGADLEDAANYLHHTPLTQAAEKKQTRVALLLVARGARVDAPGWQGNTALAWAARNSDLELFTALLEKGADVRHLNEEGESALVLLLTHGPEPTAAAEIARLLLSKGVDASQKDRFGSPAILLAARRSDRAPLLALLLDRGADPDVAGENGNTALIEGANAGDDAAVKLLLARRAKLDLRDTEGYTALERALHQKRGEAAQLLIEAGGDQGIREELRGRLLREAAAAGSVRAVTAALAEGVRVDDPDDYDGNTALMRAAEKGRVEVVKLLLARGAKLEAKNSVGSTPILFAASSHRTELVELLVKRGAKLRARTTYGLDALMCAAMEDDPEMVAFLAARGLDPNAATSGGDTALMSAAENGSARATEKLLSLGAKVDARDGKGRTALHRAAWTAQAEKLRGFDRGPVFKPEHLEIAKRLLARGADLQAKDGAGATPLDYARARENEPMVKLLLEAGAR